jgi:hydroxyethylthiazole kinase-like uncharacterized protein yjeF
MPSPVKVYTARESRELDRVAIEGFGIPGITLMKRAGRAAFDVLRLRWPDVRTLTIFCGGGNNAGDGYIVGALAAEAGLDVQFLQIGDVKKLRDDAASARDLASSFGVSWGDSRAAIEGEVVVDALIGTGASEGIRAEYAAAIEAINATNAPVLAIDLPSGISADTGVALGAAVRADVTVTFIGEKLGLFTADGIDHAGEVVFDSLEVPDGVFEEVQGIAVMSPPTPTQRLRSAHKTQFGHVLIMGGDIGMGGAVLLAGEAALRTGAGLVSVLTRVENCSAIIARRPELMVRGVEEGDLMEDRLEACNVVAIGPGLGLDPWGEQMLTKALGTGKPVVIDADALNLIAASYARRAVFNVPAQSVMTPHAGEASRLLDKLPVRDRPAAACELSSRFDNVVVLKGAGTFVAKNGELQSICIAGNPGLATAGSGDVLTGIIASFIAQGRDLVSAAEAGVCLHAEAGDVARDRLSPRPIVAGDIVEHLWLPRAP